LLLRWYFLPKIVSTTHLPPTKKLVLELEIRVTILEFLERLPSSVRCTASLPLDKEIPRVPARHGTQDLSWNRHRAPISNRRQETHGRRRLAMMLLEVDDMEDIVNASLGWQPQPISNRARFMVVTPREGVGGRVLLPGLVLHLKTISE